MRELVDQLLAEGQLAFVSLEQLALGRHFGVRGAQRLAQLLGIELVDVRVGDHEA